MAAKTLSSQLQVAQSADADLGPIVEKLVAELSAFTVGNKN
jgi:hypothetical protein